MTSVCYAICTHNRPEELACTLDRLGSLSAHDGEVIVVDNASDSLPEIPGRLANGLPVRLMLHRFNEGASARNHAAGVSDADWLVVLDDDSSPTDLGFLDCLDHAPADCLALSADIHLSADDGGHPRGREQGGLPEVFIGCGAALRRSAFVEAGGYDPRFEYYAEEYDLCARLLRMGGHVRFEPAFRVEHRKVVRGRDFARIVARLVRNNGWVEQRYAPEHERAPAIARMRQRYREIARREGVLAGYARGLEELRRTLRAQERTPLTQDLYDRFTGLAHARTALQWAHGKRRFGSCALIAQGKNDWAIERAIRELGVRMVAPDDAEALVVGTLSPGPMLDALRAHADDPRVIAPWLVDDAASALRAA